MQRCIKLLNRLRPLILKVSQYLFVIGFGVSIALLTHMIQKEYGNPWKKKEDPLVKFRLQAPPHIKAMYRKLVKLSGHQGKLTGIYLFPIFSPNAFVTEQGTVYLTLGLIMDVKNKDELAFIISHEISHVMLRHTTEENEVDNRFKEYHSDMLGLALMMRAGYNPCEVPKLFMRWSMYGGTNIATKSHPAGVQRALYTTLPMCLNQGAQK